MGQTRSDFEFHASPGWRGEFSIPLAASERPVEFDIRFRRRIDVNRVRNTRRLRSFFPRLLLPCTNRVFDCVSDNVTTFLVFLYVSMEP